MRTPVILISLALSACGASSLESVPTATPTRSIKSANVEGRISGTELISASLQGMQRLCNYRSGPVGSEVHTYRVGYSDRCPAHYPTIDPNMPMPPTARLEEEPVAQDKRNCVYTQGSGRWTVSLPVTEICPLNAGMAQQVKDALDQQPAAPRRRLPNGNGPGSAEPSPDDTQQPDNSGQHGAAVE